MSTHGYIYVRTQKKTKGQNLRFDLSLCPLPIQEFDDQWHDYIPFNTNNFVYTGKITKDFVGIFVGADAYPSGAGRALLESFNTYEKALNLVVGGYANSVWHKHITYNAIFRKGDEDHRKMLQDDNPHRIESYQYLFYKKRWYFRAYGTYWYDLAQFFKDFFDENDPVKIDNMEKDMETIPEYDAIVGDALDEERQEEFKATYKRFEEVWDNMMPENDFVKRIKTIKP